MSERLPLAELVTAQRTRLSLSLAAVARRMQDAADEEGSYCGATRQTIHEIEQGRVPHPDPLRWLAEALELPVRQLASAARRQRMNRRQLLGGVVAVSGGIVLPASTTDELSAAVPAIRRALLHYDQIVCGLTGDPNPLGSLTGLRRATNQAYRLRQAARYAALGAALPSLLMQAQLASHEATGDRQQVAFGLLAEVNHVTAGFLKKAGQHDLAWVVIDRASHAAERAELPLLKAASAYRVANLLLDVGQLAEAGDLATQAIDVLEPGMGTASGSHLSIWGALHLKRAAIAARRGEEAVAWQHLGEARATARRLGSDRNDFWTAFGPTNVAIHEVSVATDLGDATTAIGRAQAVDLTSLPPQLTERRSAFLIDLARAHRLRRQDAQAAHKLLQADRLAPEEVRHNPRSRELLCNLLGRPAAPRELRALAARSGLS